MSDAKQPEPGENHTTEAGMVGVVAATAAFGSTKVIKTETINRKRPCSKSFITSLFYPLFKGRFRKHGDSIFVIVRSIYWDVLEASTCWVSIAESGAVLVASVTTGGVGALTFITG